MHGRTHDGHNAITIACWPLAIGAKNGQIQPVPFNEDGSGRFKSTSSNSSLSSTSSTSSSPISIAERVQTLAVFSLGTTVERQKSNEVTDLTNASLNGEQEGQDGPGSLT